MAGKPEPANGREEPESFRRQYALTDLGRHAAEYGEYDKPFTPEEVPLSGTAAELPETLLARKSEPAAILEPIKRKQR